MTDAPEVVRVPVFEVTQLGEKSEPFIAILFNIAIKQTEI
jgi:hypothetical protein